VKGLVAIIDALGTKLLSQADVDRFLEFRDAITKFNLKVFETNREALRLDRTQTFTIGDTIVYAYEASQGVSFAEVERFSHVLRIAVSQSIESEFPVRGAFAIGEFYREGNDTVLGPAVTDAASWFEKADWIGVHATPHASLYIQAILAAEYRKLDHVLFEFPVPMKDKTTRLLKCVNWPKAYFVSGLRPIRFGNGRAIMLSAFAKRQIPRGTEQKYTNAIAFYDAVLKEQKLEEQFSATPSPAPSDDDVDNDVDNELTGPVRGD
jgi:hypothetical protein